MTTLMSISKEIETYFQKHLSGYEPLSMCPTNTSYIYRVMAKRKHNPYPGMMGDYAVWTCWNTTTNSLNCGHYDLSEKTAREILLGQLQKRARCM